MSELKRHKRSDAIKWTATALAFVFVAIVLVGVCLQVFGTGKMKPSEWFKQDPAETEQTDPTDANAGLIVTPSENNVGTTLTVAKAALNADNETSAQADEGYEITATVKDQYGAVFTGKIAYSLAWSDENVNDVADYVTVTESEDNRTWTLTCNKAFGTQILFTVYSPDNAEVKATATLDYMKRVSFGNGKILEQPLKFATMSSIQLFPVTGMFDDVNGSNFYEVKYPVFNMKFSEGTVENTLPFRIAIYSTYAFAGRLSSISGGYFVLDAETYYRGKQVGKLYQSELFTTEIPELSFKDFITAMHPGAVEKSDEETYSLFLSAYGRYRQNPSASYEYTIAIESYDETGALVTTASSYLVFVPPAGAAASVTLSENNIVF